MRPLRCNLSNFRNATTHAPFANVPYRVFDRYTKRLQKERAILRGNHENCRRVDYIQNEVVERMLERVQDIKREFRSVLEFGTGFEHVSRLLFSGMTQDPAVRIHGDEEHVRRTFEAESFDAVVSCLSLHWVNDLPGALVQIKECLKPNGVFLGAMLGGDTLFELRTALQVGEVDREGGISSHVSPFTESRDMSNLLGRAGFGLVTVDIDEVKVMYPNMWELMLDLRDMGESNAVLGRPTFLRRDTILAASAAYQAIHGNGASIPATFQIIFMIGWKTAPDQPKPPTQISKD